MFRVPWRRWRRNREGLAADKNVPNLAGEPDLYLEFQLVFFRKGVRKN